jgi:methylisocitrate lyase
MIFPEAINELEQYQQVTQMVSVPVLANITEFGATPLFNSEQLASVGVKLSLYPLSAFRAMSLAALKVYQGILADGSQQNVVDSMQTRMELYDFLDYHQYEKTLDQLYSK